MRVNFNASVTSTIEYPQPRSIRRMRRSPPSSQNQVNTQCSRLAKSAQQKKCSFIRVLKNRYDTSNLRYHVVSTIPYLPSTYISSDERRAHQLISLEVIHERSKHSTTLSIDPTPLTSPWLPKRCLQLHHH